MKSLANNRCGACAQCCYFPAVPELAKDNYFWCVFHEPGKGCKSYGQRPPSCSDYACLWFANKNLDESLRPDQCGVMFERLVGIQVFLAMVDPQRPNSWQVQPGRKIITSLLKQGFSIVVHSKPGGQNHILLAEGHNAGVVVEGIQNAIGDSHDRMRKVANDSASLRN